MKFASYTRKQIVLVEVSDPILSLFKKHLRGILHPTPFHICLMWRGSCFNPYHKLTPDMVTHWHRTWEPKRTQCWTLVPALCSGLKNHLISLSFKPLLCFKSVSASFRGHIWRSITPQHHEKGCPKSKAPPSAAHNAPKTRLSHLTTSDVVNKGKGRVLRRMQTLNWNTAFNTKILKASQIRVS